MNKAISCEMLIAMKVFLMKLMVRSTASEKLGRVDLIWKVI